MGKNVLTFGDIEVVKDKFCLYKSPIFLVYNIVYYIVYNIVY